ncbi:MAG: hypothetical protein ACYTFW_24190 [Planctomycetota bacterium]|jgi:hypothetical protein
MIRRQKNLLRDVITVIAFTTIAVVAMINIKDLVNRSEAIEAMKDLGQRVKDYRDEHGLVPSKSYVDSIKGSLKGRARFGDLQYRAIWIDSESTPDEVLAYTERNFRSFLVGKGYVVLRLDGRVEWMDKQQFDALLPKKQRQMETEMLQH